LLKCSGTHRLGAARVERDVVRAARGRLDDGVEGPLELVGESLARDASRITRVPPAASVGTASPSRTMR
jgi:hypothetical protein